MTLLSLISDWGIPTALVLGFTGSYHCVAMCGVIAAQTRGHSTVSTVTRHLWYSMGRVVTYAMIAAILYGVDTISILNGSQHVIAVSIGVIVIGITIARAFRPVTILPPTVVLRLHTLLQYVRSSSHALPHSLRSALLGLVNGFLPCGFNYMALAGSLLQPTLERSVVFMVAFGIGTIPVLLLFVAGMPIRMLQNVARSPGIRLTAAGIAGLLLVLRGLSLGIPYVSPSVPSTVSVLSTLKHDKTCLPH